MKKPSRKILFVSVMLAVLLFSYFISLIVITLSPYGQYNVRLYSEPQGSLGSGNSSTSAGAWSDQLLFLSPSPGSTNVPRDAYIIIVGTRPEKVYNLTITPAITIAENEYAVYPGPGPSSVQNIYPLDLLQPNTQYNVSAIVAGTLSWWTFSTSSQPKELMYTTRYSPNNPLYALPIAIAITLFVSMIFHPKNKRQSPQG